MSKSASAALGLGALLLSATSALAFSPDATYLDGLTYLVQFGSTPDSVQEQLDPSLGPNVTSTSGQHMSVWVSQDRTDLFTFDLEDKAFQLIYQSEFPGEYYQSAVIVELLNDADPDDADSKVSLLVAACSDVYCTDFLVGWALNVVPIDDNWHNIQDYLDMEAGTIHLQLDSVDGQPRDFGPTYWSQNSFSVPVAGQFYYVGCPVGLWSGDCFSGQMTELWVYSGPLFPGTIDVAAGAFWYISGNLVRANSLDSSSGTAVFGDYPTLYLRGGPSTFADANAYDFSGLSNPPVLPFAVGTITSDDGNFTGHGLLPASSNPY